MIRPADAQRLAGCRILIVEDEVMVSWLISDLLKSLGCAVVGPAARVPQALQLVTAQRVDAGVLDVNLNGQKSFPIADALAEQHVPFLFLTGYPVLPDGYCAVPRVQKPFDNDTLVATLAQMLRAAEGAPAE